MTGGCRTADRERLLLADSPALGRLESLDLSENLIFSGEGLRALGRSQHLPGLRCLSLNKVNAVLTGANYRSSLIDAPAFGEFLRSPLVGRLRWLDLSDNGLGPVGAEILAGSPSLAGLQGLDLRNCDLHDSGAMALAGSPHLGELAVLNLELNKIGNAGALALANSPGLGRLHTLRLWDDSIDEAARRALLDRFGPDACSFEPTTPLH